MELNRPEQEITTEGIALDQPHFDEESTVLSARPVVPLEDLPTPTRSRRHLAVAGVVAVALLVGVFGATLIYKLRRSGDASTISETVDPAAQSETALESGVAAEAPVETLTNETPRPEIAKSEASDLGVRPVVKPPVAPPASPRVGKSSRQIDRHDGEIADERELEKEMRRERREARRLRRAEKQAMRRGEGNRTADDLFRIREIFEGSRRP